MTFQNVTLESLTDSFPERFPNHSHLTQTLNEALAIASKHGTIGLCQEEDGKIWIRETYNSRSYFYVNHLDKTCTCKVSQAGTVCVHRLAAWLYVTVREESMGVKIWSI